MAKTIFLTGATGYVGCHLAHRFLSDGHTVLALVRQKGELSIQQRIETAVTEVGPLSAELLANLIAIPGSVQVSAQQLHEAVQTQFSGEITEVWHCAAIFNFKEREKPLVEATNIEGTRHMLDFTVQVNRNVAPRFFYISTAYSLGSQFNSPVPEHIPDNVTGFRSIYEWSKHNAERLVDQYQQNQQINAAIFRPSIVIGTPETAVLCNSGYYQVLTECRRLRNVLARKLSQVSDGNIQTRLLGNPDTPLNLVPIDFVVNSMITLAHCTDLSPDQTNLFNIVNEQPPTIKEVHHALVVSLGMPGLQLVTSSQFELEPMNPFEKKINRRIAFQAPYMHEQIHFSTSAFRQHISLSHLPPPKVDLAYMEQVNAIFLSQFNGK
ncbi:MAG: NAD-dependent epimerase/dehydratase family protein [Chloroflexi bacterium]|nr:NAD-dependent epimerase/dehydratase family protein [Chloroflexota bacterium]